MNEFNQRLIGLSASDAQGLLTGIRRGLEKESLRVTEDGYIAKTPHPASLGSALTHPYITTDYSEALLEFITPPVSTPEQAIDWMMDLHAYTYQHLSHEFLWASSMPCTLTAEKDIPIAQYGHSNIGQLKHIYRHGLAHRYGKNMQIIAGIHFNFSFSDDFWQYYQQLLQDRQDLQAFKNQQYFALMRNFLRYSGLLVLLLGASPAVCSCFVPESSGNEILALNKHTLYVPEGTSLRMSDIGYQNRKRQHFKVSYNSLAEYVQDLKKGINTIEPDYLQYHSVIEGGNQQLSPHILQIEAEYYSAIRAKRTAKSDQRTSQVLLDQGVEYIEVRVIDLDPYEPVGINAVQIRFLESFLLMCLLKPSPLIHEAEQEEIQNNLLAIAYQGRNYHTALQFSAQTTSIQEKFSTLWPEIHQCAQVLDLHHEHDLYQAAVKLMQEKFEHPEQLASSRILHEMQTYYKGDFFQFSQDCSMHLQQFFQQRIIPADTLKILNNLAQMSIEKQKEIEQKDTLPFREYVKQFLKS